MTSAAKVVQRGVNKPLSISLPPVYFDILESMAPLAGRDINELIAKRLMQIIIEEFTREFLDFVPEHTWH